MYGNRNKENRPHNFRDQNFRQTHGGRDRFPGGEWGASGEFGRNSDFRESDSSDERHARPYDMDNFQSGSQFADHRPYPNEKREASARDISAREYNRSRFAEPYTGGQFSRSQYGMGSQFSSDYSASAQQMQDLTHSGKGPKGYRRSDERIREDACEMLFHSPRVDARDIEVAVKDGFVTLSGSVTDRYSKREAENCVENLVGVQDVHNEIRIVAGENKSATDIQAH